MHIKLSGSLEEAMNTASLDHCKRLYELSNWGYTNQRWVENHSGGVGSINATNFDVTKVKEVAPAYDLGFLLQKLQTITDDLNLHWTDWWVCKVSGSFDRCSARADTPENAACELAIKLIEQGIIQP